MTLAASVAFFALLRALGAGYGGSWFFAGVVHQAVVAAAPFLVLEACRRLVLRAADGGHVRRGVRIPGGRPIVSGPDGLPIVDGPDGLPSEDGPDGLPIEHAADGRRWTNALRSVFAIAAGALAFVRFGEPWIDAHTMLAQVLQQPHATTALLAGIGAAAGLLVSALGEGRAPAAWIALAGWLVAGPDLYARWDHVEAWRRAGALLAVGLVFVGGGLLLARVAAVSRMRAGAVVAIALAVAAAFALLAPIPPHARPGPSIVLVVVDTLRADMLERSVGAPTLGAPPMPRLAEIARAGTRYTQAVSPAPWTLPSMVSLLSGMNPHRHATGRMQGAIAVRGDSSAQWLVPALRAAGYASAMFVNNPWLRPYYGFGRGALVFRRYHGAASEGVDSALSWLSTSRFPQSFVLLHLMDPHWPYEAPSGYGAPRGACATCDDLRATQYGHTGPDQRAEIVRRYEAEVAYADAEIGRLWDELRARGALDNAYFIVTSDHGEELWEHWRFLHGHSLYDELLRVPLVVVPPLGRNAAERGGVQDAQVRLEDVGATVAAIAGIELAVTIDGTALVQASGEPASDLAPSADAARAQPQPDTAEPRPLVAGFLQLEGNMDWAVRARGMKLMHVSPKPILFDLRADPREQYDFSGKVPLASLFLAAIPGALGLDLAAGVPAPGAARAEARIDPGLAAELKALGYLD